MSKYKAIQVQKVETVSGEKLHKIYSEIKAREGATLLELCRCVGITYDFLYKVLHGKSAISEEKLQRIYAAAEKILS